MVGQKSVCQTTWPYFGPQSMTSMLRLYSLYSPNMLLEKDSRSSGRSLKSRYMEKSSPYSYVWGDYHE